CARYRRPYRPEAEGALVLPRHEFGLDVIALIGALRYREHQSVPEIHRGLRERGVAIAERTVTHLLDRYDELVATSAADDDRLRAVLAGQGRAILALDGLQPDVGHEVLWVVREVEGRDDPEAEAVRGYCAAVRSAITDDGRPPLAAFGPQAGGPARGGGGQPRPGRRKRGLSRPLRRLRRLLARGLERTQGL